MSCRDIPSPSWRHGDRWERLGSSGQRRRRGVSRCVLLTAGRLGVCVCVCVCVSPLSRLGGDSSSPGLIVCFTLTHTHTHTHTALLTGLRALAEGESR